MTPIPPTSVSDSSIASRSKHLPALDGVRGLAVVVVFVFHYGGGTHSSVRAIQLFGFVNKGGWSGVVLFFVLSGFLITGILWDSYSDEAWWRKFFFRRSLRIFPLYYLSLLLVVLAAIPAGNASGVLAGIGIPALFLENMPYLDRISEALPSPLPIFHLWSIAVEEQFYLLWPWILYWCWHRASGASGRRIAKLVCVAILLGSLLFRVIVWLAYTRQPPPYEHFLITQAGALAAGGWLALAWRGPEWQRIVRFAPAAALVGLAGFAVVGLATRKFETSSTLMMTAGLFAVTILFTAVLALSLEPGVVRNAFSIGLLRWLGNISYGVYVFHVLLLPVIGHLSARIAHGGPQMIVNVVQFFVAALLSLVAANISFKLFESQFLRLKKYFVPRPKAAAV